MNEAFVWKALKVLGPNPIVHDVAQDLHITLTEAYQLQSLWIEFWQAMIRLPITPDADKQNQVEQIKSNTHTIDLGYRAVQLNIPREWDVYVRICLFALDNGQWPKAWAALWECICWDIHWKDRPIAARK